MCYFGLKGGRREEEWKASLNDSAFGIWSLGSYPKRSARTLKAHRRGKIRNSFPSSFFQISDMCVWWNSNITDRPALWHRTSLPTASTFKAFHHKENKTTHLNEFFRARRTLKESKNRRDSLLALLTMSMEAVHSWFSATCSFNKSFKSLMVTF